MVISGNLAELGFCPTFLPVASSEWGWRSIEKEASKL